jgi:hypothetical protein
MEIVHCLTVLRTSSGRVWVGMLQAESPDEGEEEEAKQTTQYSSSAPEYLSLVADRLQQQMIHT